jgi:large subunit ribosomal protein L4
MKNLNVEKGLVVLGNNDQNVVLSARNMADVNTEVVNAINVYDILSAGKLVLTKDALTKIEEVYA